MNTFTLNATNRTVTGKKLKHLREEGAIPGVIYGRELKNISVSVDEIELKKTYREAGENSLVNLTIEGSGPRPVLIYDVQLDPIKQRITHVDFYQVRLDEAVRAEVPLEFTGTAPAVKELGGTLVKVFHGLEVEALPQDIPHAITVDISKLATFEDQIEIRDLAVAGKFKILAEPKEIVARVLPPRTEEELEALKEEVKEDVTKVEGVADKEPEAVEAKEVKEEKEEKKEKEE